MAHIITRPKIDIEPSILDELNELTYPESQVIVHCIYQSPRGEDGIRIWPTTYLFDQHSDHVSTLAHAENISMYPIWTWTKKGDNTFTLIFTGLPKSCAVFDLIEDCNGSAGSFRILSINRTQDDVYYINF